MKIKVTEGFSKIDASRIKQIQLNKAKAFFQSCPFATKIYVAMKTRLPITFIQENWREITQ